MSDDDSIERPSGPLGMDPLHFSVGLFVILVLYVFYLMLPRAMRKQYFGAYPKRHAWSARSRSRRTGAVRSSWWCIWDAIVDTLTHLALPQSSIATGSYTGANSSLGHTSSLNPPHPRSGPMLGLDDDGEYRGVDVGNDEIVISAAMQQLRDPGVLIVAHGSRGKPKTVRLQLTESAITWRTETRKKGTIKPKLGKLHQVPLSHIMYVDVGKQTTALRRVENASVNEALCFSLLTKEGSLDLEANSPRERDALVSCFSLVLDEVHAQNWRDIYRGPSSDMPSSFDELDQQPTDAKV